MTASKKFVSPEKFAEFEAQLRKQIAAALEKEIALCADLDLDQDKNSGELWSSLPTVDSKTAHKISVSIIEQLLDCVFQPAWIKRGGYTNVDEATNHVIDQLRQNCVKADVPAVA